MGGPCNTDGKYKRHPYNCNKYYQCVYNQYIEYSCAGGLHWHERGNLCDWPASAKCKEPPTLQEAITQSPPPKTTVQIETRGTQKTTIAPTSPKTTRMPPTRSTTSGTTVKPYRSPSLTESCNNGAYRANVDDCESYFICVNHRWIRQDCGYGLQFDQVRIHFFKFELNK